MYYLHILTVQRTLIILRSRIIDSFKIPNYVNINLQVAKLASDSWMKKYTILEEIRLLRFLT